VTPAARVCAGAVGEAHFAAPPPNRKSLFPPVVYASHPRLHLASAGAGDRDDHTGVMKTL
jgi:hypothetical protein